MTTHKENVPSTTTLEAEKRGKAGKGSSHALRRAGRVPAVIYGAKQAPMAISLAETVLARHVVRSGFFTHLFDVDVEGQKHRVLPRDAQFDPVSDKPIHVDFLRVSSSTKVRVAVPVHFIDADKAPGIKRGGTLNIVHHEIAILCAPDKIPEAFEVSLEGRDIGDAIHLESLKLPEGAAFTSAEKGYTIATIAVPSAIRSEAQEAAAAAATAEAATAAEGAATDAAAAPAAGAKAGAAAAAPAAADKAAPAKKK